LSLEGVRAALGRQQRCSQAVGILCQLAASLLGREQTSLKLCNLLAQRLYFPPGSLRAVR
jgi:hypothetical protein